jgi:hypothetical protein
MSCLVDKLFDLGVFSDGQRGKGIIHNATRPFAATRREALKSQSHNFFSLRLGFRQFAQQSARHMNFDRSHWKYLSRGILEAEAMGVKAHDNGRDHRAVVRDR